MVHEDEDCYETPTRNLKAMIQDEMTPSFKPKTNKSPVKNSLAQFNNKQLASKQLMEDTSSLENLEEEPEEPVSPRQKKRIGYHLNLTFINDGDEHRSNTNRRGKSMMPCSNNDKTNKDTDTDRFYRKKHTSSPMHQYNAMGLTNRADANQNKSTIQSRQ